jgi:hypothetical protein
VVNNKSMIRVLVEEEITWVDCASLQHVPMPTNIENNFVKGKSKRGKAET